MEENINKKLVLKDKFFSFLEKNKLKLIILFFLVLISMSLIFFLKIKENKKNILISEKYIQAGIYLTNEKKKESKQILEEIILSDNNFYKILALNTILEKDLEDNNEKILNYFRIVEKSVKEKEKKDLIKFKKALYLLKNSNIEAGEKLLKTLINSESKLKFLAKEILSD